MPQKEEKELHICYHCGYSHAPSKFYKSQSGLYSGVGHLPICKSCFDEQFGEYTRKYRDSVKAMHRMCMAYDLYFNESLFKSCDPKDRAVVGKYFRKLNIVQYKNYTFDSSLNEDLLSSGQGEFDTSSSEDGDKIDPNMIQMWGEGFSPADYDVLGDHYKLLKDANPQCDSNQEIFINDLCYIKMQQMRAIREGRVDDFSKLTESYRKTFTQAGLKTVRDTSADEDFTIGVNIETIEKYTPAEYYKNKELYKDFDGLGDYISRFLLRPLRNLMHGTTDRDHEFYVKDEDGVNGYNEE